MDADIALTAPPQVSLAAVGPRAQAVADVLAATFTAPSDAEASGAATRVTTGGCHLAILTPDAWSSDALAAALAPAPHRWPKWIAVVGASATDLSRLDETLEGQGSVVDALIAVADNDAAGLALEAWIRLRHDAPARAFADLRDADDRACRVAAIAAVAPTAMPPQARGDRPSDGGELATQRLRAAAAQVTQTAGERVADRLATLESSHDTALASALTAVTNPPGLVTEADLEGAVTAVVTGIEDDPHVLGSALTEAAELQRTTVVDASNDAAHLDAAAMALVAADAALSAESQRTGFAAKFGRKKRLTEMTATRAAAFAAFVPLAQATAQARAQHLFASRVRDALTPRLEPARQAERVTEAAEAARARSKWLADTIGLAAGIHPPIEVDPAALSTSWGSAAPGIRRYLLLPEHPRGTGTQADAAPDAAGDAPADQPALFVAPGDPAGVVLHTATDLTRPIAAALVLGVPAAAVRDAASATTPRPASLTSGAAAPSPE